MANMETGLFAIVCDLRSAIVCDPRSSGIVCDHMETSLKSFSFKGDSKLAMYLLTLKSDFLRKSSIGRHSRKVDFSFISPKRTFERSYSRKNSLKFPRFILRAKFRKDRNLHVMAVFAA